MALKATFEFHPHLFVSSIICTERNINLIDRRMHRDVLVITIRCVRSHLLDQSISKKQKTSSRGSAQPHTDEANLNTLVSMK